MRVLLLASATLFLSISASATTANCVFDIYKGTTLETRLVTASSGSEGRLEIENYQSASGKRGDLILNVRIEDSSQQGYLPKIDAGAFFYENVGDNCKSRNSACVHSDISVRVQGSGTYHDNFARITHQLMNGQSFVGAGDYLWGAGEGGTVSCYILR